MKTIQNSPVRIWYGAGGIALAVLAQIQLEAGRIELALILWALALLAGWFAFRPVSLAEAVAENGHLTAAFPRQFWMLLAGSGLLVGVSIALFEGEKPPLVTWIIYLVGVAAFLVGAWHCDQNGQKVKPGDRWGWYEGWALALILAAAVFMRLYLLHFYPYGVWADEADYGSIAREWIGQNNGGYPIYVTGGYDAPAHFLFLIAASFKLFGVSAYSLRMVSAAFGIGTVLAGYLAGRELVDRRFGLIAAFLLAVSRWDVNFSRLGMHCVTTPFFALLAVGFLLRAIRRKGFLDYALSGLALGLGVCFYTAFRVFPAVIAIFLAAFAVTHRDFLKTHAKGLLVFTLAAVLVTAPVIEFSLVHADIFWERTNEVSLIANTAPENLGSALLRNTLLHLEMFNLHGDANGRHNLPGAPMLDTVSAGLMVLGLGLWVVRLRNSRAVLVVAWLGVMLVPGIFSLDFEAPQALRSIGALPPAYLAAALPLWMIAQAGQKSVPGRWANGTWALIALLLVEVGASNFNTYFQKQVVDPAAWSVFSTAETISAEVMNRYGSDYDYYLSAFYDGSPTISFLAPQVSSYHVVEPDTNLPMQMNPDKGAIFLLDPDREGIWNELKDYYPQAEFKIYTPPNGSAVTLYCAVITRAQVNQIQGLKASYWEGTAESPEKDVPADVIEKAAGVQQDWQSGDPLALPFHARWSGVLYVPEYGDYTLTLITPGAQALTLDDQVLLQGSGTVSAGITLAKGAHPITVDAQGGVGRVELRWTTPQGIDEIIPAWAFYTSPVTGNGLLGVYYANGDWTPPAALEEITAPLDLYFHHLKLNRPYTVEWSGLIRIDTGGDTTFSLRSVDESNLSIDGTPVVSNPSGGKTSGVINLTAGFHSLIIRFADRTGSTQIAFSWQPPGGEEEIVPADVLYLPTTDTENVALPVDLAGDSAGESLPTVRYASAQTLWTAGSCGSGEGQLSSPRGLAVDATGSVYVADAGNHRVVKLDAQGNVAGIIGAEDGRLTEPSAVAAAQDGGLVVLDPGQEDWLVRFDAQGAFEGIITTSAGVYHPRGLGLDGQGNLLVADTGSLQMLRLGVDGTLLDRWGGVNTAIGQGQPVSIGAAPDGTLYWIEAETGALYSFAPDGTVSVVLRLTPTNTLEPPQLAVDARGNVYFTDPEKRLIYGINAGGELILRLGSQGSEPGQFERPTGIAVGADGTLYVADSELCRIQALKPE